MVEAVEQQRHRLYRAEREASTEYGLFLETTPPSHDESSAKLYSTRRQRLRTNLHRAEAAREQFDAENPVLVAGDR